MARGNLESLRHAIRVAKDVDYREVLGAGRFPTYHARWRSLPEPTRDEEQRLVDEDQDAFVCWLTADR
jgi:hypothetical protein